ncbi:hypothetical protein NDU88_003856 [Pleurodeles waltl]|uniref:Uncharacterized protein n=1 Tax=Pleurodeles waltl TaxID=8319 RepID=A0AAV7LI79_PLEWA|nr:hypothetical protein NDU88_003856 [Pleurodeles waltl]
MAAEGKVQQALRLLEEAGRLDLVRPGAAAAARPVRKAASGVATAVMACSPPRCANGAKQQVYDLWNSCFKKKCLNDWYPTCRPDRTRDYGAPMLRSKTAAIPGPTMAPTDRTQVVLSSEGGGGGAVTLQRPPGP